MKSAIWPKALESCADPERARHYFELFQASEARAALQAASLEQARVLAAVWSGSPHLSDRLLQRLDWLPALLDVDALRSARTAAGLRREVATWLGESVKARQYDLALSRIRQFKQRESLRIAARDLARLASVDEITAELSDVADVCLDGVYRVCRAQLGERLGEPYERDPDGAWKPSRFCVLGMGKLGGRELNYSSDVDVLFVYSEEGHVFRTPPRKQDSPRGLANHQFFKRLAESFVAEVGRSTADGMLYRIDLRLRPDGPAGPLARSVASYENYYAQWGQTWERMMLMKARCVAGDSVLAEEFLDSIQSFRFPRSLSESALREIAAMKQRIEDEIVGSGDLDRNVKLGRGGIREIEFIVQTHQLLGAGRQPFLAWPRTLEALERLVRYQRLQAEEAENLAAAYRFLRDLEHRLQMEENLQTHTLPTERQPRLRLARQMGFATLKPFEDELARHRRRVRAVYDETIALKVEAGAELVPPFGTDDREWLERLANHKFRDPAHALRLARAFVLGPGFGHQAPRTEAAARELLARLLAMCPRRDGPPPWTVAEYPDGNPTSRLLSDPDRVLARLDTFISAYGSRALLLDSWRSKPTLFELLVLLFDRSEFLAETAIRTPDMVDELEQTGHLLRTKDAAITLRDLRYGAADEDQRLWLRRYHQTELMRIGLREILGLADFEQNLLELSALGEACLQYALEVALRQHKLKTSPIAIIGLGKLGGAELNYGSDLDVVFVADDKVRNLPALQKVAVTVMDLVGSQTEYGVAFEVDPRLRPDGEKGLLVNTLRAFEDYYRQRAWLWEIQALSRCRAIAGNPDVGRRFEEMAARLCNFSAPASAARAGQAPDWRAEIARMRARVEKERTPPGKEALAIKTGAGGLMDAEFIAQTFCLEHGWREPNTLKALMRAGAEGALSADDAKAVTENYRRLRRVEGVLRRWSYEGETELPDDPAPLYRVAIRCGFTNPDDFLSAVARYRENLRRVYRQVFGTS
ncbi:MAG: bifunctional [glutamate--ammonia ligase]-adenylyl-L-tyrosine phosphorylase/[glutamate--ammonia-ligase] adenylyltransferase [Verrucomicrobia bacterium]|nr:bifunctional [glutamate--ammonia ligase]-adenylyl-L-tyrosine phosphorylase/[glutamate--ammonia-ligase] adenylyltransferase [Verrucomicrobiota bacterium]